MNKKETSILQGKAGVNGLCNDTCIMLDFYFESDIYMLLCECKTLSHKHLDYSVQPKTEYVPLNIKGVVSWFCSLDHS